jgi:hypothetical protein
LSLVKKYAAVGLDDAYADGLAFDFVCGNEVYGSCTELWEFLEGRRQVYALRVASPFMLTLAAGTTMICTDAVGKLLKGNGPGRCGPRARDRRAGLDRHRLPAAQLAHPPLAEDRPPGLLLLLRLGRARRVQGPADQGSWTLPR